MDMPLPFNINIKRLDSPVLVVGLGISGFSCVQFLSSISIDLQVCDTRTHPPLLDKLKKQFPNIKTYLGTDYELAFKDVRSLVVSPGVALENRCVADAIKKGIPIWGDFDLFYEVAKAPVIGITGSNGKSTVTALVNEIARYSDKQVLMGGNIGIPCLDLLNKPIPDYYLLELSSFQLERAKKVPLEIACCLNLSNDHLDRYNSIEDYHQSKLRIYDDSNVAIVNLDDNKLSHIYRKLPNATSFSTEKDADICVQEINNKAFIVNKGTPLIETMELRIRGDHNVSNALAAVAIAGKMGLSNDSIEKGLIEFAGLEHRCEWIGEKRGVTWINDSKGTNASATQAAIEGFAKHSSNKKNMVLIAGGISEDKNFTHLINAVRKNVSHILLSGQHADLLFDSLKDVAHCQVLSDFEQCVQTAFTIATPGSLVLFSPACKSFDSYESYHHRGRSFKSIVNNLILENSSLSNTDQEQR